MKTQTLEIAGMSCGHCLKSVKEALTRVEGLTLDELQLGRAVVTFDESKLTGDVVAKAVRDAGYDVLAAK